MILGKYIFSLFGLTIPAFKITGGILIFFVGFEMIRAQEASID
ncbi:MarC family protein, partial [Zunongwangia profunda]